VRFLGVIFWCLVSAPKPTGLARNFFVMALFESQYEQIHITDCSRVIQHCVSWLFQAFTDSVNTPSD
jgi:hypothetical protein